MCCGEKKRHDVIGRDARCISAPVCVTAHHEISHRRHAQNAPTPYMLLLYYSILYVACCVREFARLLLSRKVHTIKSQWRWCTPQRKSVRLRPYGALSCFCHAMPPSPPPPCDSDIRAVINSLQLSMCAERACMCMRRVFLWESERRAACGFEQSVTRRDNAKKFKRQTQRQLDAAHIERKKNVTGMLLLEKFSVKPKISASVCCEKYAL